MALNIAKHLSCRQNIQKEYIFPLNDVTRSITLFANNKEANLPGVAKSSSLRPTLYRSTTDVVA